MPGHRETARRAAPASRPHSFHEDARSVARARQRTWMKVKAERCAPQSTADDLVLPLDDLHEFLRRYARQSAPNAFGRECPNLADLHPRPFRQPERVTLHRQREARSWFLTRDRHADQRPRPLIKPVMSANQPRAPARLFVTARRVKIRPPDLPS